MATSQSTRSVLLRSVDYGDTDRILTLFTEGHGRVSAIAKGARRSRRRFLNAVQPFSLFEAQLDLGPGDLARLKAVEIIQPYSRIMTDLGRIDLASSAILLLRSALPHHAPEPRLFRSTLELLELLNKEASPQLEHLLGFQVQALGLLGLGPRFDQCGRCGRSPRPSQPCYFDPTLGALVCGPCGHAGYALSPAARWLLSLTWAECVGADAGQLTAEAREQAHQALSAFIEAHLGGTTG